MQRDPVFLSTPACIPKVQGFSGTATGLWISSVLLEELAHVIASGFHPERDPVMTQEAPICGKHFTSVLYIKYVHCFERVS